MMKKTISLLVIATALIATSCNLNKTEAFTKQGLVNKINVINDSLINPASLEKTQLFSAELLSHCVQYADSFPADSLAADYLYMGTRAARMLGQHTKAISMYNKILRDYPNYNKAVECLFFKGFVYDADLKQKDLAKEVYEEVIKKYPDHRFAEDAKILIEQLYLSDEELIKMFEEQNKKNNQAS